jgi:nitroreductase
MIELLCNRRSIRIFQDQPVEKEKINRLLQAALLSPSSRSFCPWEFIVVTDKNLLKALSLSKEHGSKFLINAPLVIVVIADPSKSDVWIEDASIATLNIQLEAELLELGSCWVQIRNRNHNETITSEAYVKNLLEIPKSYKVLSMVGIGYKAEEKDSYTFNDLDFSKVHYEKYK